MKGICFHKTVATLLKKESIADVCRGICEMPLTIAKKRFHREDKLHEPKWRKL